MRIDEFSVGKTYRALMADFQPEQNVKPIPGKAIVFTVLEPANAQNSSVIAGSDVEPASHQELKTWADFLRVRNHLKNKIHLLHPESLVYALEVVPSADK